MPKRATAREVAELAGYPYHGFIRAQQCPGMRISEETRQRVFEAARQLDYHPTPRAGMAYGQTHVIGFVLRQSPDQSSPTTSCRKSSAA